MEVYYKEPGETMNQFIIKLQEKLNTKKLAYTARLDPMARGLVPVLINSECKNINNYLKTNKIYRVKIIKGIQTDSDDCLGIIQNNLLDKIDNINHDNFNIQGLPKDVQWVPKYTGSKPYESI